MRGATRINDLALRLWRNDGIAPVKKIDFGGGHGPDAFANRRSSPTSTN